MDRSEANERTCSENYGALGGTDLLSLVDDVDSSLATLMARNTQRCECLSTIRQLQRQNKNLKVELTDCKAKLYDGMQGERKLRDFERQLKHSEHKLQKYILHSADLQKELNNVNEKGSIPAVDASREAALQFRIEELGNSLRGKEELCIQLQTDLESFRSQVIATSNKHAAVTAQLSTVKGRCAAANAKATRLERELQCKSGRVETLTADQHTFQDKWSTDTLVKQAQTVIAGLKTDVRAKAAALTVASEDLQRFQARVSTLEIALAKTLKLKGVSQSEATEIMSVFFRTPDEKDKKIVELTKKLNGWEADQLKSACERDTIQRRLALKSKEYDDLKSVNKRITLTCSEYEAQLQECRTRLEEAQAAAAAACAATSATERVAVRAEVKDCGVQFPALPEEQSSPTDDYSASAALESQHIHADVPPTLEGTDSVFTYKKLMHKAARDVPAELKQLEYGTAWAKLRVGAARVETIERGLAHIANPANSAGEFSPEAVAAVRWLRATVQALAACARSSRVEWLQALVAEKQRELRGRSARDVDFAVVQAYCEEALGAPRAGVSTEQTVLGKRTHDTALECDRHSRPSDNGGVPACARCIKLEAEVSNLTKVLQQELQDKVRLLQDIKKKGKGDLPQSTAPLLPVNVPFSEQMTAYKAARERQAPGNDTGAAANGGGHTSVAQNTQRPLKEVAAAGPRACENCSVLRALAAEKAGNAARLRKEIRILDRTICELRVRCGETDDDTESASSALLCGAKENVAPDPSYRVRVTAAAGGYNGCRNCARLAVQMSETADLVARLGKEIGVKGELIHELRVKCGVSAEKPHQKAAGPLHGDSHPTSPGTDVTAVRPTVEVPATKRLRASEQVEPMRLFPEPCSKTTYTTMTATASRPRASSGDYLSDGEVEESLIGGSTVEANVENRSSPTP
jgi:hypothetical protein